MVFVLAEFMGGAATRFTPNPGSWFAHQHDEYGTGVEVYPAGTELHPAGPEDLSTALRCITWGVPRLGGNFGSGPYSFYQIVQTPKYVVLLMEVARGSVSRRAVSTWMPPAS